MVSYSIELSQDANVNRFANILEVCGVQFDNMMIMGAARIVIAKCEPYVIHMISNFEEIVNIDRMSGTGSLAE